MKFRTDFVTNSSSSSFMAVLKATLDNGEVITAGFSAGAGDGQIDVYFNIPQPDYQMREEQIKSINAIKDKCVKVDGQFRQIESASMRLMSYGNGEYSFDAMPKEVISHYLGSKWKELLERMDTKLSKAQQFDVLRMEPFLSRYTDDSIRKLIRYVYDKHDFEQSDITLTVSPDGTIDLKIKTGYKMFKVYDFYDDMFEFFVHNSWFSGKKGKLILQNTNTEYL